MQDVQRVHPRSRGAASPLLVQQLDYAGPSPLARGSLFGRYEISAHTGSIPARAGQPEFIMQTLTIGRVHPRSRGAAVEQIDGRHCGKGPSPLARGSLPHSLLAQGQFGSIPARAGQP